jgi:hypothetical protein
MEGARVGFPVVGLALAVGLELTGDCVGKTVGATEGSTVGAVGDIVGDSVQPLHIRGHRVRTVGIEHGKNDTYCRQSKGSGVSGQKTVGAVVGSNVGGVVGLRDGADVGEEVVGDNDVGTGVGDCVWEAREE